MRSCGIQVLVCDLKMLRRGVTCGILLVSLPSLRCTPNKPFFLEQLEQDFLFWKHLHGFWRTLPNFNLHTASSEPGQDLAANVLALIQGRGRNNEDEAFGADAGLIDADNDEREDGARQSDKQVRYCPHPPCLLR